MGQLEAKTPVPVQDARELLMTSRVSDLRASSDQNLRKLVVLLEVACEAARVAALRKFIKMRRQAGHDVISDQDSGFTGLFAALRRARGEVKRRQIARLDRERRRSMETRSGPSRDGIHTAGP